MNGRRVARRLLWLLPGWAPDLPAGPEHLYDKSRAGAWSPSLEHLRSSTGAPARPGAQCPGLILLPRLRSGLPKSGESAPLRIAGTWLSRRIGARD
jgi:hypothetical protein